MSRILNRLFKITFLFLLSFNEILKAYPLGRKVIPSYLFAQGTSGLSTVQGSDALFTNSSQLTSSCSYDNSIINSQITTQASESTHTISATCPFVFYLDLPNLSSSFTLKKLFYLDNDDEILNYVQNNIGKTTYLAQATSFGVIGSNWAIGMAYINEMTIKSFLNLKAFGIETIDFKNQEKSLFKAAYFFNLKGFKLAADLEYTYEGLSTAVVEATEIKKIKGIKKNYNDYSYSHPISINFSLNKEFLPNTSASLVADRLFGSFLTSKHHAETQRIIRIGAGSLQTLNGFTFTEDVEIHDLFNQLNLPILKRITAGAKASYKLVGFKLGLLNAHPTYGIEFVSDLVAINLAIYTVNESKLFSQGSDKRLNLGIRSSF